MEEAPELILVSATRYSLRALANRARETPNDQLTEVVGKKRFFCCDNEVVLSMLKQIDHENLRLRTLSPISITQTKLKLAGVLVCTRIRSINWVT